MKTAYFILGMHRSGTSALAGVLNIMGLEFGSELMPPHQEDNPKGYFENNLVVGLNERILSENNSSWDDISFNLASISKEKIKLYVEDAKDIIKSEFQYAQQFIIKDPRICLLFPIWKEACEELNIEIKMILPYRSPMEVAQSLKKRDNFSIEKGLLLWTQHFLFAEYFSRDYRRVFIFFDELLSKRKITVDTIYKFVNLKGQKKRKNIDSFLEKNLKHNNVSMENITKEIPRFLKELLDILQTKNFNDLTRLDTIKSDFIYSQKLFQYNYQEQKIELDLLKEKVKLLEQIKDLAMVDEDYYLQTYPDLSVYDNSFSHHYFNYGKDEGKKPNQYCAVFDIDTKDIIAKDEENYLLYSKLQDAEEINTSKSQEIKGLNQEINELVKNLVEIKELKEQLSEEFNKKLQNAEEVNRRQSKEIEEQSQKLEVLQLKLEEVKEQKEKIGEEYNAKLEETEGLNQEINELVKDLVEVKELKEQLSEEFNKKLQNAEEVNRRQSQEIEEQGQKLEVLQLKLEEGKEQKEKMKKESLELNTTIDIIVSDLASIKESKCWIYTKPLRDIQKIITGTKDE